MQFTDQSTNSPTQWAWDFGDGNTSFLQNPTHNYAAAGAYTVTLTATNALGSSSPPAAQTIEVVAGPPTASFANPGLAAIGQSVQFTDQSTNSPTQWAWDFGDGNTSFLQNPTHNYAAAGVYTVTLTATNALGSSSPPAALTMLVFN